jgi:hypothetical protein
VKLYSTVCTPEGLSLNTTPAFDCPPAEAVPYRFPSESMVNGE